MTSPHTQSLEKILSVIQTVHRLRAPGGCAWDREQTHASLTKHLIEETYEVCDAIQHHTATSDYTSLKEELGDVLLQILLHSEIAQENGAFSFADVCEGLNEKLIRRHPHVFGTTQVSGTEEILKNWEKLKAAEKENQPKAESILDSIPKSMPALERTEKLISKVTKVGFQWDSIEGPLSKMEEELAELKEAIQTKNAADIENELGDVLFCSVNLASVLKIPAEQALRNCLKKFESRFRYLEHAIRRDGKELGKLKLDELDHYWLEAKSIEAQTREAPKN